VTATLVLPGTAPEADWHAARRNGITASEIAVLMGLSPYGSPFELYHRKLGNLPETEDNDAMAIGRHMESWVAAKFAERHPEFTVTGDGRALFAHPDRPWQMATPDRLIEDTATCGITERDGIFEVEHLAVLECKVDAGNPDWGEDGSDQIPVHYRCQVLWQCDVLGVTAWYLALLDWMRRRIRIYRGVIDEAAGADLRIMRAEAEAFLRRVAAGDPPDVDWRPATTSALKRLHPSLDDTEIRVPMTLARKYQAACTSLKAAEQRKKLAENKLRDRLGSGRRVLDALGRPVARRDVYDLPEKTIIRKATTVDRLVAVKPKEDSQ